jgi:hypothetical protein
VIAQGSNFGLGAYFLKYGREYEREADLLGAQIMARAGYDPRRMADMFRTIEQQSRSGGGPEWLSSHPNPGNRYDAIMREAADLRIEGSQPSNADFNNVQDRLRGMSPAWTAEQIARAKANGGRLPSGGSGRDVPVRAGNVRVERPSGQYQNVTVGNFMRLRIPTNWRRLNGNDTVTFAPEGGYYQSQGGGTGFSHGLQVGVIANERHSLQEATDELIDSLQRGNPQIRRQSGGYVRESVGGRTALTTNLRNVSDVTGEAELVQVSTVQLRDGSVLYLIAVAPMNEANAYQNVFARMKQSVQLSDQAAARYR